MKKEGPTAAHFRKFRVSPSLSRPCDLPFVNLCVISGEVENAEERSERAKACPCPVHAKRHRKERKDKSRVNANHF